MNNQPVRVQRRRVKDWKKPPNTIYVGRGSKWGNPIKLIGDQILIDVSYRDPNSKWKYYSKGNNVDVVQLYEALFRDSFTDHNLQYWSDYFKCLDLSELMGKNLMCYCSLDNVCHADVLLKLSNRT